MHTVGMVEVLVRNALDRQLSAWWRDKHSDGDWLDLPVRTNVRAKILPKRAVGHPNAMAHLRTEKSSPNYHSDTGGIWWLPDISRASGSRLPGTHSRTAPADPQRRRILAETSLKNLHFVRNRVAHHEPLHGRDLTMDLRTSAEIAGWISPTAQAWVLASSTLLEVMDARP